MSDCVIIGKGIVGTNLGKELESLNCDYVDKYKNIECAKKHHKFGFICVDTPFLETDLDITEVINAINENDCDIYIIKSTVPVGSTEKLKELTGKKIVFSPEYYGGTQHCNNFNFDFTILDGNKKDCVKVIQILQNCYDARHKFKITDSKTAELTKFMENSWLATKVTFCTEFFRIAENLGVEYEELRELWLLDERVNAAHTFVYRQHPYFQSHCLDKDVPAIAIQGNSELLKKIIEINKKNR